MDRGQLWGNAVIEHPLGVNASIYESIHSDVFASVYCLTFIFFFLLWYKYISRSIVPIIHCCFRFSQTVKAHDNISLEQGRFVLLVFSIFHFAMVAFFFVQTYEIGMFQPLGWLFIPLFYLILILFYGAKYALFAFIGWVIRQQNELTIIAKGFRDFFILASITTFPLYFVTLFSWPSIVPFLSIWCITALLLSYILFLYRTFQYFLHFRFSVFFYILYLCILEIAPLTLLYSVFITI